MSIFFFLPPLLFLPLIHIIAIIIMSFKYQDGYPCLCGRVDSVDSGPCMKTVESVD